MSEVHVYLGVQRLTVSSTDWATLLDAMRTKGDNASDFPHRRNHWRTSIDETVTIFEAAFESANVDIDWFKGWLGNLFGVDPSSIGAATGFNQYGRFVTFSHPAGVTNRFRIGAFGFVSGQGWPAREQSRLATLVYIKDNLGNWQVPEGSLSLAARIGALGNALMGGRVDTLAAPTTLGRPAFTTRLGERIWNTFRAGPSSPQEK